MIKQLTLSVALRDDATFENFFVGENALILHHVRVLLNGEGEHFIYLYGDAGVGVSHVLQATCHAAFARSRSALYLSLSDPQLSPEVLQDLESIEILCLDNLEHVLGDAQWEEALLHLYNRVREQGTYLLMGAREKPGKLSCRLLDLKSRLSWGLVLPLKHLNVEEKGQALMMRANYRGFALPDLVRHLLLKNYAHSMHALFEALDRLDAASLTEKCRLTLPFAKQVLGLA